MPPITSAKERRVVEIDGEMCCIRRLTTEREVRTEDFLAEITKNRPVNIGFIPRGCIWCSRFVDDKNIGLNLYIIEIGPHMRRMQYRTKPQTREEEKDPTLCLKEYQLSWPNTLWAVRMRGVGVLDAYLMCTKESVHTNRENTQLYVLPVPNQHNYGSGHFCIGTLNMNGTIPLDDQVERLIDYLLNSTWNTDLSPHFDSTGITSLEDWEKKSKDNPEFHKEIKYRTHAFSTFRNMIQHLSTAPGAH